MSAARCGTDNCAPPRSGLIHVSLMPAAHYGNDQIDASDLH